MKYVIRKFEGSFWVDVLEFVDARQLGSSDAVEVVREKVLSGGLPFFGGVGVLPCPEAVQRA